MLNKEQYSKVMVLLAAARTNAPYSFKYLDLAGYDIVPIDEDPSKTKEERAEIRRIQREKKLAEEERKQREEEIRKNRQIDNQIIKDLRLVVKYWNQEVPFKVDDVTIAEGASFNNPKIYYKYKLLANKSDFSAYQWDALKSTMKENLKSNCQDVLQYFVTNQGLSKIEIKEAFERIGLSWNYIYRDISGRQLFTIEIKASDLN